MDAVAQARAFAGAADATPYFAELDDIEAEIEARRGNLEKAWSIWARLAYAYRKAGHPKAAVFIANIVAVRAEPRILSRPNEVEFRVSQHSATERSYAAVRSEGGRSTRSSSGGSGASCRCREW